MKKSSLSFLLMLLLITSCNFPSAKPTLDGASLVATRVAQTLVAASTATIDLATPVAPTNSLPTPSAPTETPTQTVTVTPTVSPTLADIKSALGSPVYENTFTSGSNFDLPYTDEAVKLTVHDGVLDFVSLGVNYGLRYQLTYPKPQNFYLEGVFQTVSCSGLDHYGLVARAPNYADGYGYYAGFSCDGQYRVQKWDGGGLSTILDWSADSHILSGAGQTNRLGIWMDGTEIKLYANGALIKEFSDTSLSAGGHYGIFGGAVSTANFNFTVSEIAQWNLP